MSETKPTMRKRIGSRCADHTGKRFGSLTVQGFAGRNSRRLIMWKCVCDCGQERTIVASSLTSGNTKSCGCQKAQLCRGAHQIHGATIGGTKLKEYLVWVEMRARCNNPRHRRYADYGGRGIQVCESWASFERFINDMGKRPEGATLERKNNDSGYSPENCAWRSRHEQANNTRKNALVTWGGRTQTVAQWSKELKMKYITLYGRLFYYHWPVEKAFTEPMRVWKNGRHGR